MIRVVTAVEMLNFITPYTLDINKHNVIQNVSVQKQLYSSDLDFSSSGARGQSVS